MAQWTKAIVTLTPVSQKVFGIPLIEVLDHFALIPTSFAAPNPCISLFFAGRQ